MRRTSAATSLRFTGTALVTGASSGLGNHYAEFLARNGMDLILTARSADRLEANAEMLRARHGRTVTVLPADLADQEQRRGLVAEIADRGLAVEALINNAGFGTHGEFAELDNDRVVREIELNCVALTDLSRTFLPGMIERGSGFLVNVASTAAYQPIPTMAVYAATKSYVLSFTQALWSEVRGTGVRVTAICPGPTETEFFDNIGEPSAMANRRTPDQVIRTTFRALAKDRPNSVDGTLNRLTAAAAKVTPVKVALPLSQLFVRPS